MVDRERVSRVLVDASLHGIPKAAELHGISQRTVKRYRTRMTRDAELARLVAEKQKSVDADWAATSLRMLHRSISKLEDLIQEATPDQIRQVAGAIKIVGELQVVREALGYGEQSRAHPAGPAPAGDASQPAGAGPRSPDRVH